MEKYKRITLDLRLIKDEEEDLITKLIDAVEMKVRGIYCIDTKEEDVTQEYKDYKTTELCCYCGSEVEISANGVSKCPECSENILPCSLCISCLPDCPYTKEYEMLTTFPEDDKHFCSRFYVPKKWLSEHVENVVEFKDVYIWDESYMLMQEAKADGVFLQI